MSGVWFNPTESAAACFYNVVNTEAVTFSLCGIWRSKVPMKKAVPALEKGLAPNFEICPKCAALLKIKPKPQAVFTPHFTLFSPDDKRPIEEMKNRSDVDPPDELEGVDLNKL